MRMRILRSAASLFRSNGYARTSLREVADVIGLSKAGVYHYFSSKEELLAEIAERAVGILSSRLEQVLSMDGSIEDKLRDLVVSRVEAIAEEQDMLTVFWQDRISIPHEVNDHLRQVMASYRDAVSGLIRQGQKATIIRPHLDPEIVALGLIGITGWFHVWYRSDGRLAPREIGENFWAFVWGGLCADAHDMKTRHI